MTYHRLSRALKLRTYQLAVCSTLTHASEAWMLTEPVMRSVNGFNSRCVHVITGQDYRVTATYPECDLLLAIRQRRLRYLGHILRMPECSVVRRAMVALAKGGTVYPKGSLFISGLPGNGDGPASGTSTAAQCVECTDQTITMRWTATSIRSPGSGMERIGPTYWTCQPHIPCGTVGSICSCLVPSRIGTWWVSSWRCQPEHRSAHQRWTAQSAQKNEEWCHAGFRPLTVMLFNICISDLPVMPTT